MSMTQPGLLGPAIPPGGRGGRKAGEALGSADNRSPDPRSPDSPFPDSRPSATRPVEAALPGDAAGVGRSESALTAGLPTERPAVQPPPTPMGPSSAAGAPSLGPMALVEHLERDGRVRACLPVTRWPLTVGRAIDNDIVLDDPFVAAHHLRVNRSAQGAIELHALPSVNGVALATRKLKAGERMPLVASAPACEVQVGNSRLRIRLAGESLAPERALPRAGLWRITAALALVLWLWGLFEHWLMSDPGGKVSQWLSPALALPAALAAWSSSWALASKLFQGRFDFWPHLSVAVRWLLGIELVSTALPLIAASTAMVALSRVTPLVVFAMAVLMVLAHTKLVLPRQGRALAWAAGAGFTATALIMGAMSYQRHDRWFSELYNSQLPLPGLPSPAPVPPEEFLLESASLQLPLDKAVRDAAAEQKADGEGIEEE